MVIANENRYHPVRDFLNALQWDGTERIRYCLQMCIRDRYNVVHQLVNASDYGVPQNRQRVLFVGVRKDLGITFEFPKKQTKENLTLRHILDVPQEVANNVDWALSPQALDMICLLYTSRCV